MLSFLSFDMYGNKADTSVSANGVRVQNEGINTIVSSNVFVAIESSFGTSHASAAFYFSGNSSISHLQGAYGKHVV
jgi:hypothetical protein